MGTAPTCREQESIHRSDVLPGTGNAWVALAVVEDRFLAGYWHTTESRTHDCPKERDGTLKWGRLDLRFHEDFSGFIAHDGASSGPMAYGADGHRLD